MACPDVNLEMIPVQRRFKWKRRSPRGQQSQSWSWRIRGTRRPAETVGNYIQDVLSLLGKSSITLIFL